MWFLLPAFACPPTHLLGADGRCSRAEVLWGVPDGGDQRILMPDPDTVWSARFDEGQLDWTSLDLRTGETRTLDVPYWPIRAARPLAGDRTTLAYWDGATWQTQPFPAEFRPLGFDGDDLLLQTDEGIHVWDGAFRQLAPFPPGWDGPEGDHARFVFRVGPTLHTCAGSCVAWQDETWKPVVLTVPQDVHSVATTADGYTWAKTSEAAWIERGGTFQPVDVPAQCSTMALTPWGLHCVGDGRLFVHDGTRWSERPDLHYRHTRVGADRWVSSKGLVHAPPAHGYGVDTSVVSVATVPGGGLLMGGSRGLTHLDAEGRLHVIEPPLEGDREVAVLGDGTWVVFEPESGEVFARREGAWVKGPKLPGPMPRRRSIDPRIRGVLADRLVLAGEGATLVHWSPGEAGWTTEQAPFPVDALHTIDGGVWAYGTDGQTAVFTGPGGWTPSVRWPLPWEQRATLQLRGGEVLVVGGKSGSAATGTVSTEFCEPLAARCRPGPMLPTEVYGGGLVELNDGRVLLLGGDRSRVHALDPPLDRVPAPVDTSMLRGWFDASPFAWDSIVLFERSRWVEGAPLLGKGAHPHGATVLADGRVMVLEADLGPNLEHYDPGTEAVPFLPIPSDRVGDLAEIYCLAGQTRACAQLTPARQQALSERFPR